MWDRITKRMGKGVKEPMKGEEEATEQREKVKEKWMEGKRKIY